MQRGSQCGASDKVILRRLARGWRTWCARDSYGRAGRRAWCGGVQNNILPSGSQIARLAHCKCGNNTVCTLLLDCLWSDLKIVMQYTNSNHVCKRQRKHHLWLTESGPGLSARFCHRRSWAWHTKDSNFESIRYPPGALGWVVVERYLTAHSVPALPDLVGSLRDLFK
jgi:hypothetical protein